KNFPGTWRRLVFKPRARFLPRRGHFLARGDTWSETCARGALMKVRHAAALCSVALLLIPRPTVAWNPLADLGHFFGSIIGAPFGGAIEAAVTPTIQGVEGSGHRLIQDLDERLANTARDLLQRTNATVAARLDQVDDKLAARILQVGRTGDELVD